MRTAFIDAIGEVAARDRRVTLIVGDLGFGVVEPLAARFPAQFLNAGVAEQNMTGVAAGMALMGRIVFTYSIANFPTLRCLEQIRNDVCYHDANVKIVAVGGGFAYGALGMTHHATEDLAIMRALPNMVVVAPGDPVETREAVRALVEHPGPAYLRLGRTGEKSLHAEALDFRLGRAIIVRAGRDLTLISTGGMLEIAMQAAADLAARGLEARVLSMHTVKPLDHAAVLDAARETRALLTVEEHSCIGGLGGAVAEVLAEAGAPRVPFRRLALASAFTRQVGSQEFLRQAHGLTPQAIAAAAANLLREAGAVPALTSSSARAAGAGA